MNSPGRIGISCDGLCPKNIETILRENRTISSFLYFAKPLNSGQYEALTFDFRHFGTMLVLNEVKKTKTKHEHNDLVLHHC